MDRFNRLGVLNGQENIIRRRFVAVKLKHFGVRGSTVSDLCVYQDPQ